MTKPLKQTGVETLVEGMADFFDIVEYEDIMSFALNRIDLSDDVSAPHTHLEFDSYPYLVEPIKACAIEDGVRKEVVIAMSEQMGKTTAEICALLHAMTFNQLQAIILYPSSELAVETSSTKFLPLFKKIPQFQSDLEKPFAIRSDRFKLSNAILYWGGAGVKCVSKTCKLVLGDECAVWQNPPNVNNLEELKKRTRAHSTALQLFVSTPTYKENPFWVEFLNGSQGYWTLRCPECNELTMRSCDVHNLQFSTVYSEELKCYVPVYGSCRMVCPKCGAEITEDKRRWMTTNGAYLHTFPDRVATRPSFQAGVLASLLTVHSWDAIAEQQLRAGKTAELSDYVSFDNSIRGLPYQEREYRAQDETALSKLSYTDIPVEDVEAIYLACDTQDAFSVLGRFALTRDNEVYLIDINRPRYMWLDDDERRIIDQENRRNGKAPEKTVLDYLDEEVCGMRPLMCLIDRQGHRQEEVSNFSRMRKNIVMYSGTSLKYDSFKPSENVPKLFLFNEKTFRSELIFKLYFDKSRLLRLPKNLSENDIAEITCIQPDKEKRNGSLYENWEPLHDEVHDAFDVIKMGLCAIKMSPAIYRKDRFRFGEAKVLNPMTRPHEEKKEHRPRPQAPRRSLFR